MSKKYEFISKEYFAAANGFTGFRSYFDKVFQINELEKLFIIKGGPGTGKSSFMKKCAGEFYAQGKNVEYIYCSSDPRSLDGILIDGRIGIIDGTAPHTVDARLPGAVDEIINLGAFWNDVNLMQNRRKIIEINKNKSAFYKSAYFYLSFCENISNYIQTKLKEGLNVGLLKNDLDQTIRSCEDMHTERESIMLISSFSSHGYKRISNIQTKETYCLNAKDPRSYTVLNFIRLSYNRFNRCIVLSPFSDNLTEAVIFPNLNISFTTDEETFSFDLDKYFSKNINIIEINKLISDISSYCNKAQEYFKFAMAEHFELEKIYTAAMNFERIEEVRRDTAERINNFLSPHSLFS